MRQEEDVEVCDCALSADPQVRRERRALVTLMNSDRVDLDEGARSWKFHKCVCLKMDSGPLWQFSLINNSLLRVASNLDEEESKELLEGSEENENKEEDEFAFLDHLMMDLKENQMERGDDAAMEGDEGEQRNEEELQNNLLLANL